MLLLIMTSKAYNQRVQKDRLDTYKAVYSHLLISKRKNPEPSEAGAGYFSTLKAKSNGAGLLDTHVLTSVLEERRETLINEAFKEWEDWLKDYSIRQLARKRLPPYSPIAEFVENPHP